MEQIPVKKIETVLVLAEEDKQKQKEFYELLLTTQFYVAGSIEADDSAAEGTLRLRYFQGEGRWIVPFFTQLEFVKEVLPEETPLITIRGKELFKNLDQEATAVLNVGTELSKTFIPEEIADIASGRIFHYYQ
ncbi:SseB family protein [Bacillus sp. C1]